MIGTGQDITERRRLEEERDRLLDRRAPCRRVPRSVHRRDQPRAAHADHDDPGPDPDPGPPGRVDDDGIADGAARGRALRVRAAAPPGRGPARPEPRRARSPRGRCRAARAAPPARADRRPRGARAAVASRSRRDLEPICRSWPARTTYVEQIVRNLLGNAAKYTPAGTHVVVDARRRGRRPSRSASPTTARVSRRPRSTGSSSCSTATRTSARAVAGSGIGLFVCASLVEAMGGRMWAARRPEGGSGVRVHACASSRPTRSMPTSVDRDRPVHRGAADRDASRGTGADPTDQRVAEPPAPADRGAGQASDGERVDLLGVDAELARRPWRPWHGGSAPQRASATIVAAAMCGGSISNSARRSSRVSLRPKPSVPERDVVRRQPAGDHVGQRLHPVGRGHDRPAVGRQHRARRTARAASSRPDGAGSSAPPRAHRGAAAGTTGRCRPRPRRRTSRRAGRARR